MAFFIRVHSNTIEQRRNWDREYSSRHTGLEPRTDEEWAYGYANNYDVIEYLRDSEPFEGTKIPPNFHGEHGPVPLKDGRETVLRVDFGQVGRTARDKSSKHRVFAVCPDCKAEVPAGRAHQHKCKGR